MPDEPLTFTATSGHKAGTTILKVAGPITLSTMFPLQAELRTLRPPVLIIDFTDVPYIDSAGIGLFPSYFISAQDEGRNLLLAGLNHRVAAILGHTKIDTMINTFPSVGAAEASLS
jgi:anti-sigma B factor antagonist